MTSGLSRPPLVCLLLASGCGRITVNSGPIEEIEIHADDEGHPHERTKVCLESRSCQPSVITRAPMRPTLRTHSEAIVQCRTESQPKAELALQKPQEPPWSARRRQAIPGPVF